MRLLYCFIFLLLFNTSEAQNGTPTFAGARGVGMGNTGATVTGINGAFTNQAGLAYLKGMSFTLNGGQRFLGTGINDFSVAAALPVDFGSFGVSLHYFGISDYNEQKIGLAYARKLMPNFAIGAQFDVLSFRTAEYGSTTLLTFEIGLLLEISKQFSLGTHIYSPVSVSVVEGENLPGVFTLGLGYKPSKKVKFNVEVEKELSFSPIVRGGIEYNFLDALFLRTGFSTEPTLFTFGFGFKSKKGLNIDFGSSYHQSLGFSPVVSVSWTKVTSKKR